MERFFFQAIRTTAQRAMQMGDSQNPPRFPREII